MSPYIKEYNKGFWNIYTVPRRYETVQLLEDHYLMTVVSHAYLDIYTNALMCLISKIQEKFPLKVVKKKVPLKGTSSKKQENNVEKKTKKAGSWKLTWKTT